MLLVATSAFAQTEKTIKVFQLNIWQEGTVVEGGYEAIADQLAAIDADFVMLSEVRNYNNTRFCDRIVASLLARGKRYYSFYSNDSGVLSKYPIVDSATIFPNRDDHGSMYRLTADMDGRAVAVYTTHMDYLNCAYYAVRGYDPNTFKELPAPITDTAWIMNCNRESKRDDAASAFIADAKVQIDKGALVFLGGDFNEPSHLDWIASTANMGDHQGLILQWTVTTMLEKAGYKDAYRTVFKDPVTHPGFTYPADTPLASIDKLAWSPKADDRERIDYIFYHPSDGLTLTDITIIGPSGSICRAKRTPSQSKDPFFTPDGVWGTDHKGVLATFRYQQ